MKNYLEMFIDNKTANPQKSVKRIEGQPSKPSEAPFVGFDGNALRDISEFQSTKEAKLSELQTETEPTFCPSCSTSLESQRGKLFLHLWCPSNGYHFDSWRALLPATKLSETDAPFIQNRKTFIEHMDNAA